LVLRLRLGSKQFRWTTAENSRCQMRRTGWRVHSDFWVCAFLCHDNTQRSSQYAETGVFLLLYIKRFNDWWNIAAGGFSQRQRRSKTRRFTSVCLPSASISVLNQPWADEEEINTGRCVGEWIYDIGDTILLQYISIVCHIHIFKLASDILWHFSNKLTCNFSLKNCPFSNFE
jgi:hypothetical protein